MERRYVRQVLAAVGGNKTHAARILGIDRRSLYRRLEEPRHDKPANDTHAHPNNSAHSHATPPPRPMSPPAQPVSSAPPVGPPPVSAPTDASRPASPASSAPGSIE